MARVALAAITPAVALLIAVFVVFSFDDGLVQGARSAGGAGMLLGIVLIPGALLIALPLWWIFRARIDTGFLPWTALGALSAAPPGTLLLWLTLSCIGFGDGGCNYASLSAPDLVKLVGLTAACGALYAASAWLVWRRLKRRAT